MSFPSNLAPYIRMFRAAAPRRREPGPGSQGSAADSPALEIDSHGSPVTMPEAEWLICFVPGLRSQWWHRFAHPLHKHVFAIRRLENGTWLLVEPWWTRLMVNVLTFDQALKFLRWGAAGHILKVRESIPGRGNQMRGWSNCAVLMAFLLGRSYWTWTPDGLYRRLVADAEVEAIELLPMLGEYFQSLAEKVVHDLSSIPWRDASQSLYDALLVRATAVVAALTSPSAQELHGAGIQASSPFQDAAVSCWRVATQRGVASIREVLESARARGEIEGESCATLARNLVATLLDGTRPRDLAFPYPVSSAELLQRHVTAVVSDFLACHSGYRDMSADTLPAIRGVDTGRLGALAAP